MTKPSGPACPSVEQALDAGSACRPSAGEQRSRISGSATGRAVVTACGEEGATTSSRVRQDASGGQQRQPRRTSMSRGGERGWRPGPREELMNEPRTTAWQERHRQDRRGGADHPAAAGHRDYRGRRSATLTVPFDEREKHEDLLVHRQSERTQNSSRTGMATISGVAVLQQMRRMTVWKDPTRRRRDGPMVSQVSSSRLAGRSTFRVQQGTAERGGAGDQARREG